MIQAEKVRPVGNYCLLLACLLPIASMPIAYCLARSAILPNLRLVTVVQDFRESN
ncbi:MAG: hypothetical protein F6K26_39470 [Moorea sp. SIO2I5]|nr:hypothetical protein [Moorena sp. SIO2I5]